MKRFGALLCAALMVVFSSSWLSAAHAQSGQPPTSVGAAIAQCQAELAMLEGESGSIVSNASPCEPEVDEYECGDPPKNGGLVGSYDTVYGPDELVWVCVSWVSSGGKNAGAQPGAGSPYVGDPINASTGNKYSDETDYTDANHQLTFHRYYNSIAPSAPSAMCAMASFL